MHPSLACALFCLVAACATSPSLPVEVAPSAPSAAPVSSLGAFSVSLVVKDLAASRAFYEQLGFSVAGGEPKQNWLILRNGTVTIGLFHGMFERNTLTFNPGWDAQAKPIADFTDVRVLQQSLKDRKVALVAEADAAGTGPAFLMLQDPDGNPVLVDQHVAAPRR
jgi:catechol 2,3-dioxygenase-like lactoylglutathione lyase family enzyme